jgi:hypothetical protein
MVNIMLDNKPKIIFIGFDDKPIDLAQSLTKRVTLQEQSTAERQLSDYFKALYNVGEATQ